MAFTAAENPPGQAFCGMPGNVVKRCDGGLPVEGDPRQEPRMIVKWGRPSRWYVIISKMRQTQSVGSAMVMVAVKRLPAFTLARARKQDEAT